MVRWMNGYAGRAHHLSRDGRKNACSHSPGVVAEFWRTSPRTGGASATAAATKLPTECPCTTTPAVARSDRAAARS